MLATSASTSSKGVSKPVMPSLTSSSAPAVDVEITGSPAAIASFTVIAARELGRYGVTVNSISPSALTRMTEDLRQYTDEDKKRRDPKWVAPVSTWLVSEQSREITGRVFQAGNGIFAVAEGWHKGPEIEQIMDPYQAGKALTELAKKARKNAGMNGLDLD